MRRGGGLRGPVRSTPPVDLTIYLKALGLLVRNPTICLAPLLAGVANILLFRISPASGGGGLIGGATSSIVGLMAQLIDWFGLAVAIVVASLAWRRGRTSFDDAWDQSRARAGDILFASLGFGFVIYLAGLIGSFLGAFGALALTLVAYFGFVYTLPAAAIGGTPGGAALNASIEIAKRAPLPTLVVTAVYFFAFSYVPTLAVQALQPVLLGNSIFASGVVSSLVVAAITAIVSGYVALVLAKTFEDLSYGRRWG